MLLFLAFLVAGCSGGDERAEPEGPTATWAGPPRPDPTGQLEVEAFNDLLENRADLARSPLKAGIEFARLDRAGAASTSATATSGPEGTGPTVVVVTANGLLDDSVRASRYVLQFVHVGEGNWRLRSARWVQRCWAGRGHQVFAPRRCV